MQLRRARQVYIDAARAIAVVEVADVARHAGYCTGGLKPVAFVVADRGSVVACDLQAQAIDYAQLCHDVPELASCLDRRTR